MQENLNDTATREPRAPQLIRLDTAMAPALLRLMPSIWVNDWDSVEFPQVFHWHYFERRSDGGTWLVSHKGQCVAMLDSFVRPYLLEGRRVLVRETADWYCAPNYRPFGLGLKLMRLMMDAPEPIIVVGGTEATRSILPRLGWRRIGEAQRMIFPVTLRGLAGNFLRRWGANGAKYARAIPGSIPLRSLRSAAPPTAAARIEEWRPGQHLRIPLPRHQGLVEMLDAAELDWFYKAPRNFIQPIVLVFLFGSEPVGLSLSQIEPSKSGPDGKIVHLQVAAHTQTTIDWIIFGTARRLAQAGVGLIRCRASLSHSISALRRAGFVAVPSQPVHWWAKGDPPAPSAIDVGYLCANDALPIAAAATLMSRSRERTGLVQSAADEGD